VDTTGFEEFNESDPTYGSGNVNTAQQRTKEQSHPNNINNSLHKPWVAAILILHAYGWGTAKIAKAMEETYDDNPEYYEEEIQAVIDTGGFPSFSQWSRHESALPGEIIEEEQSTKVRDDRQNPLPPTEAGDNSTQKRASEGAPGIAGVPLSILPGFPSNESSG
jgi:hypothetical protein